MEVAGSSPAAPTKLIGESMGISEKILNDNDNSILVRALYNKIFNLKENLFTKCRNNSSYEAVDTELWETLKNNLPTSISRCREELLEIETLYNELLVRNITNVNK